MKWVDRTYKQYKWHRWFAWRPVKVNPEKFDSIELPPMWVWWEIVERRIASFGYAKFEYRIARKKDV